MLNGFYCTGVKANGEDTDQVALMHRLVLTFSFRICTILHVTTHT